jgi:hypothetical protein
MSCNLSYSASIVGDCNNSSLGSFTIDILGSAPDYTIQWLSPYTTTIPLGAGVTTFTQNFLSHGTYTFNIIDSCTNPPDNSVFVNLYISSGTCVSIINTENTLCGMSNGALTATTSNLYGNPIFYLYDNLNGFISSATTNDNFYTFSNLSASTYYVIANDGGGCTGKSETCIIKSSSTFDYGFYTVNDAGCTTHSGKIYVTGLTGNPPFSYLWSNGKTDSFITGLTGGDYSVTITDNTGCIISKSVNLVSVIPVSIGSLFATSPTCFSSNGEVTAVILNGTPPYYYSGSNGTVHVSFSTSYTFTGLGPGQFSVQVTDAGLCTATSSVSLLTPNGFTLLNVGVNNSNCNNIGGSIKPITLLGGSGNYVYTLTYPSGGVVSQSTTSSTWGFENLSGGTYTLNINDGVCSYTNQYTIVNEVLYDLIVTTTGTTNNLANGLVNLSVTSGGTPPYTYLIQGNSTNISIPNTPLSSYTFNNLTYGSYTAKVTDSNFCSQLQHFVINSSVGVNFVLIGQDAINGNDGVLSVLITDGNPPFTIQWQGVLSAQTGSVVNNVGPGTYCVKVIDYTGGVKELCTTINGYNLISSTQFFNSCESTFTNNGDLIEKGIKQMFFEGYYDLTYTDTNCILNQANFVMNVTVGDYTTSALFFVSYSLTSFPSTNDVINQLENLIGYAPHIGNVTIQNNTITITTDCEPDSLVTTKVIANIVISYDISCVSGCVITPTPTNTPTQTHTPTPTQTPTMTPTPTPTSPLIYYVLGNCPNPKTYIIQHILPVTGLVVGDYFAGSSIYDGSSTVCYKVYDSSTSLSQLQAQYPDASYPPPPNYFNSVVNSIFKTCEDCNKAINIKSQIDITQCNVKYEINKNCSTKCDVGYGSIKTNNTTILDIQQNLPSGIVGGSFMTNVNSLIEIYFDVLPSNCGFRNGVNIGIFDEFDNLLFSEINVIESDVNPTAYFSFVLNSKLCSENIVIKISEYCSECVNWFWDSSTITSGVKTAYFEYYNCKNELVTLYAPDYDGGSKGFICVLPYTTPKWFESVGGTMTNTLNSCNI